jgi:hypothetical protein
MTAVISLAISRENLLSSNMRIHWGAKARATRAIREMAFVMCQHARPARMPAATCEVVVTWPDNRQRDALNLEPTIKAAIDGIIGDLKSDRCSYMLLPSDSDQHLRKVSTSASPERIKTPGIAAYLTFTFTEVL